MISILAFLVFINCNSNNENQKGLDNNLTKVSKVIEYDTSIRVAHILVSLCDNKYQGIIPVPPRIGNGEDLEHNLYWGCSYGISAYFKNSKDWTLLRKEKLDSVKLERVLFKHKLYNFYLVCDAYNGKHIQDCTIDFLKSASGKLKDTIQIRKQVLGINSNAKLLTYIGHNGLMDFRLTNNFKSTDSSKRDVVILACKSKKYFTPYIQSSKANPILWTTDLMCPEAYTIHDLLTVYIQSPNNTQKMHEVAAKAYAKHQKCSQKSAEKLLVSGW